MIWRVRFDRSKIWNNLIGTIFFLLIFGSEIGNGQEPLNLNTENGSENSKSPSTALPIQFPANPQRKLSIQVVSQPQIIVKQIVPASVADGANIPVVIHVQNQGSIDVDNLTIQDKIPKGFTLLRSSAEPVKRGEHNHWFVSHLRSRQEVVIEVVWQPEKENPANQNSSEPSPLIRNQQSSSNSYVVQKPQEIQITPERFSYEVQVSYQISQIHRSAVRVRPPEPQLKMEIPTKVNLGEKVPIKISIKNPGNVETEPMLLQSQFSRQLTHPRGNNLQKQLAPIPPHSTKVVTLELNSIETGKAMAEVHLLRNQIAVLEKVVHFEIVESPLQLKIDGPRKLELEKRGIYEIVLLNPNPTTVSNVEFLVELPAEIAFQRATDQGNYLPEAHAIRWNIGKLKSNESRTISWSGSGKQIGIGKVHFESVTGMTQLKLGSVAIEVQENRNSDKNDSTSSSNSSPSFNRN